MDAGPRGFLGCEGDAFATRPFRHHREDPLLTRRFRRLFIALAAAVGLLLVAAGPAQATSPVRFGSSQLQDQAGVLGGETEALRSDISQFKRDSGGVELYVAFVDSFTGPTAPQAWAEATVKKNNLGKSNVALLFVATDTRKTYIAANSSSRVGAGNSAAERAALSSFSKEEWAGGVRAAMEAWIDARQGTGANSARSAATSFVWVVPVLLLVVLGGVGVWFLGKRRKRRQGEATWQAQQGQMGQMGSPTPRPTAEQIAQLRAQAGPLLIAADDAIRTSEQELGFAEAAYGEAAVKTFQEDLTAAKAHLAASFRRQQALDDEVPDSPEEQFAWSTEIIDRCHQVSESLNKHRSEFDGLRKLESQTPAITASLLQGLAGQRQRLEQARTELSGLSNDYADSAVRQVQDNTNQASSLLDFVQESSNQANAAVSANKPGEGALAARSAQQASQQAEDLITAIESTRTRLAEARTRLEGSVRAAAQDLAQAKAALTTGGHSELAGPVAALETALEQVRQQISSGRPDPLALLASVDQARAQLDGPLAAVRDRQSQLDRAAEALTSVMRSAESKIEGTEDFVRARRGGVGAEARTRLAEARRLLGDAASRASTDPEGALASAQRAEQLADTAAQLADQDVQGFSMNQPGGMGGMGGGMNSMGGAILGGILGSVLLGGGSNHSSNDGGFFGGGGDGGFGGFGGGSGDFGGGFGGFDGGGGDF